MYKVPGCNHQALQTMTRTERIWYLGRLADQLQAESKAIRSQGAAKRVKHVP